MKKVIFKPIILFTIFILLFMIGCKENNAEPERKLVEGTEVVTVSSTGQAYNKGLYLEFNGSSELFTLEQLVAKGSSFHSSIDCDKCGFEEYNDKPVYHICNDSAQRNGFVIRLKKPVKASSVTGISMTYMASKDAKSTEARIFSLTDSSCSSILNESPFLSGATKEWVVANLHLDDFEPLADENGYVHGFQIFIRNKDNAHFYINNLTFKVDAEVLSNVEVPSICLYESGATQAIAEKIRDNFQNVNIASEVTVYCESYLQNSSKYDGEITYSVDIKVDENKTFSFYDIKQKLPHLENEWLIDNDPLYGATQTTNTNWQKDFNNGGILTLSNREITCAEGIDYVEYVVVKSDADYTDESIEWCEPQVIKYNKKGIEKLYINAFLDYGDTLKEGEEYKIIVRAVSNNENYIAHIDHNFVYSHYSKDAAQTLIDAYNTISQLNLASDGTLNTEQDLKAKLKEIINNNSVIINIVNKQEAGSTDNYKITLSYDNDKFKSYSGKAFVIDRLAVLRDSTTADSDILPISPYDGESDILISTQYIINHWDASFEDRMRVDFENYIWKEVCTPPAISFSWRDKNEVAKKEYTLIISEDSSFTKTMEHTTKKLSTSVDNLKAGQKYYWKVVSEGIESPVFVFETCKDYTRYINAAGVLNMRDIGGYVTQDNKIIKQGLIYRSANLDSITAEGRKTDLDLREDYGYTPLGKDANYFGFKMQWYGGIFTDEAKQICADVIKVFTDESNYPIDYHCAIGRDRTGTLTILLFGILGIDEETAKSEYFLSFYSQYGAYSESEAAGLHANINGLMAGLDKYGDKNSTFNEKVVNYLLDAGVTHEEMDKIREIMLEDAPVADDESDTEEQKDSNNITLILVIVIAIVLVATIVIIWLIVKSKKTKASVEKSE